MESLPADNDDYWYTGRGLRSSAGAYVSPETALRLAPVYACTRVVSETIGSLPGAIYRKKAGGGKERADDHPLSSVLRKPNPWQTSFEFWEMMQAHLELRGNSYSKIVSGNGRAIDQLIPLHPDRVRVFRLGADRLRYEVISYYDGTTEKYTQEEILHLRAMSFDGVMGMSTISAACEVVGVGLAQQEHRARSFANRAIPGLYLKPATKLDPEARDNLQKSMKEGFSGANAFKAMVGIPGMEITQLGISNRDAQLIEASDATRTDIASMFRIPPHKIGDLTRGTFSNIEQQNIEFATDSIRPRVVRLERRINLDLIDPISEGLGADPGDFYFIFDMDDLSRGDMKSRYDAYQKAVGGPWMAINEARANDGKNPVEGGDEILRPVNMQPADQANDPNGNEDTENLNNDGGTGSSEPDTTQNAKKLQVQRLKQIANGAADRCVRKELVGLRDLAKKAADSAAIDKFYADHAAFLMKAMAMTQEAADEYVNAGKTWIKVEGIQNCIDRVQKEGALALGALAYNLASAEFTYLSTLAQSMRINQIHSGAILKKKIKLNRDSDGRVTDAEVEVQDVIQ